MGLQLVPPPGTACRAPFLRSFLCASGNVVTKPVRCGECAPCGNQWRKVIRGKIFAGIDAVSASYKFLTLTARTGADIDSMMYKWRKFRRSYPSKMFRFFRVVQPHKNVKRVHLHILTDMQFPDVSKPNDKESLKSWYARQSIPGRIFINVMRGYGFGPIMDCQKAYQNGRLAPVYMATYLSDYYSGGETESKTRSLRRFDGRRVRVAEGSRNWRPVLRRNQRYRLGMELELEDYYREQECTCEYCVPLQNPDGIAWQDRRRAERWRFEALSVPSLFTSLWRAVSMALSSAYSRRGTCANTDTYHRGAAASRRLWASLHARVGTLQGMRRELRIKLRMWYTGPISYLEAYLAAT